MIWIIHFLAVNILLLFSVLARNKKIFIYGTFIYSVFTFGQRWMAGVDFPYYLLYYLTEFQVREPFYKLLQNALANYNLYFGILIFVIYTITLFNNYRFILKLDKSNILIIYLFLFMEIYFMQMSQIRQFIAISFFINAYFYAFDKKYYKLILNILFACLFHISAILVIPFLFIKLNFKKKYIVYLVILCFILPFIDIRLIFNTGIFGLYSHYLGGQFDQPLSIFHMLRYYAILGLILIILMRLKFKMSSSVDKLIINGLLVYLFLYGLSFKFAPVLRVSNYFKIFEVVFLCYYYKEIYKFNYKLVRSVIISVYICFYAAIAYIDPYHITRYEFKPLKIYDDKTNTELYKEVQYYHLKNQ